MLTDLQCLSTIYGHEHWSCKATSSTQLSKVLLTTCVVLPQAGEQVVDILLRAQHVQYPSAWEQVESQSANTQLYNVDLVSSEVADLVTQVQASGKYKVLKVRCHLLPTQSVLDALRKLVRMHYNVEALSEFARAMAKSTWHLSSFDNTNVSLKYLCDR